MSVCIRNGVRYKRHTKGNKCLHCGAEVPSENEINNESVSTVPTSLTSTEKLDNLTTSEDVVSS